MCGDGREGGRSRTYRSGWDEALTDWIEGEDRRVDKSPALSDCGSGRVGRDDEGSNRDERSALQ